MVFEGQRSSTRTELLGQTEEQLRIAVEQHEMTYVLSALVSYLLLGSWMGKWTL